MSKGLRNLILDKRMYYTLLVVVCVSVMLLLSVDVFTQSRDGRRQIVDQDGGTELPVDGTLQTEEELRLAEMLSNIEGVGENRVMITWQEREDAVSVFASESQIRKIQGVIVAAEGASKTTVKLTITDAVTSIYGIPTSSVMVFQLEQ